MQGKDGLEGMASCQEGGLRIIVGVAYFHRLHKQAALFPVKHLPNRPLRDRECPMEPGVSPWGGESRWVLHWIDLGSGFSDK